MKASTKVPFGKTGLEVTALGFGTAPLGNIFREISEQTSNDMMQQAWDAGIRFYDTAPMYGHGLSELRTGHSLRWKNRDDFILSSKVGRILQPAPRSQIDFTPWTNAAPFTMHFDYSYDGVMRSFEDSLQKLALERMDICFIHDIDRFTRADDQPQAFEQGMDGAWHALSSLKSQGLLKAVGVGVNEWEVCEAALMCHEFDCFLLAGRYTLLEQNALDSFLPLCVERNVAVVIGGALNSGILATGATQGAKYNYAPAPGNVLKRVSQIEEVCRAYDVSLPAAALQFVVAHPAIPSLLVGTRTNSQLQQNIGWFEQDIPSAFWQELIKKNLIREDAPVPNERD